MAALKYFFCHFVKRLALQNTNSNCFAVINSRVMILNLNSVVPIKTLTHGTVVLLPLSGEMTDRRQFPALCLSCSCFIRKIHTDWIWIE